MIGLCRSDDNLCIYKKIIVDDELGCSALVEIDLLHRLKHPNIASPEKLLITDKTIILLFPFAEKTLRNITEDKYLPTSQKLPILHKISLALNHLHQHNILYLNLRDNNILIRDGNPLLIDFHNSIVVNNITEGKRLAEKYGCFYAPELLVANVHNEKTDVWSFGMLMLSVLIGGNFCVGKEQYQFSYSDQSFVIDIVTNNVVVLSQNISSKHRDLCINLMNKIFSIDPHIRPSFEMISKNIVFGPQDAPIVLSTKQKEQKEIKLSNDFRDILKLLIHWVRILYGDEDMILLFLAVDLYNKAGCFFTDHSADDRMHLAVASMSMAAKLVSKKNLILDEYITSVSDVVINITKENIIDMELEIIRLLEGNLAESELYNICTSIDQLAIAFEDIIMNKDSTIYCNTNIPDWIKMVKESIPNSDAEKRIMIKDFFG